MLIAKAKDPQFWETVRTSDAYQPFREELAAMWERECTAPVPACRFSDFIQFAQTGSRVEYEHPYFLRRRQMNVSALLAMIHPGDDRYLTCLMDVIWAILDEYVWCVPAHMPTLTENMQEHIDLFSSETGFALSEISDLLGDRLPPLIRSRIQNEVNRRIIQPYLHHTYSWETVPTNWSAVCLNGVIGAILYQQPDLLPQLLPRAEKTIHCFLSGFTSDGVCLEGFSYWGYGFGFFTCLADLLHDFSGGKINWFSLPKVREISGFAHKMLLDGNVTVSFSDSGTTGAYHIGLLHYLKQKYPDDVQLPSRKFSYTNDGCGRWCLHLRAILWFDEQLAADHSEPYRTDYLKEAGWFLKVTPHYSFAAKGGTNDEPHNHNDLGTFLVVKHQKQLLIDAGSGQYTQRYFSSDRYEDFHTSSRSHCVPVINGQYQSPGASRTAVTSYENGVFTVAFEKGYAIPALTSLRRSFRFEETAIILQDQFSYDGTPESFVERFVSCTKPQQTADGILLDSLLLRTDLADLQNFTISEEWYPANNGTEHYYLIDFALKPTVRTFQLIMDFLANPDTQ